MTEVESKGYTMMMNGFHIIAKEYISKNYRDDITMNKLYEMNIKYLRNINKKFVEEDENFKRYYDLVFKIEYCKFKMNK